MAEGRNTGAPLILNALKSSGSELPSFKTDGERSSFRVIRPIHPLFLPKRPEDETVSGQKAARKSRDEERVLILAALHQCGNLSMNELSAKLKDKKLRDMIRSVVNELVEDDKVKHLYPDRPKSRKQKFRLVEDQRRSPTISSMGKPCSPHAGTGTEGER